MSRQLADRSWHAVSVMGATSEFRSPDRGYRRRVRTVPGPTDSVVVVGAGLGGLSAALHLAGAGRLVTVSGAG